MRHARKGIIFISVKQRIEIEKKNNNNKNISQAQQYYLFGAITTSQY